MQKFILSWVLTLSYGILIPNLIGIVYAEQKQNYGPIQSGESLWGIGRQITPSSVSRHQALVALHKANPQAFSTSCNMNSLKIGETLRIPSLSEMQALSKAEAIQEMTRQQKEWQERRQNPIVCPPVVVQSAGLEGTSTTEQANKPANESAKSFPTESSETPMVAFAPSSTATTNSPSPVAEPNIANGTQTVALVPDDTSNNTPNDSSDSLFSPMIIIIGLITIVGLLVVSFIWLARKRAKKKPIETEEAEASENQILSEPINEMPLPTNLTEKSS